MVRDDNRGDLPPSSLFRVIRREDSLDYDRYGSMLSGPFVVVPAEIVFDTRSKRLKTSRSGYESLGLNARPVKVFR